MPPLLPMPGFFLPGQHVSASDAVVNGRQRIHGTLIVYCRFAHMRLLEIVTHVEALIFGAAKGN